MFPAPDKKMVTFLKKHHVFTLATSHDNKPWCCQCFYVYIEELCGLIFTSDHTTRHITEASEQPLVAGSVVLETNIIGKIQGIQLEGRLIETSGELLETVKAAYLKRFPVAHLMKTTLWLLELSSLKMTDNRLGFGKKLYWKRDLEK